jgi:hypothetical protein
MKVILLVLAVFLTLALLPAGVYGSLELWVVDGEAICTGNRHISGMWVKKNNETARKTFFCCDPNHDFNPPKEEQMCGNTSIGESITFQGSLSHMGQITGSGCSCDRNAENRSQINIVDSYDWAPSYCKLLEWNATQFCELLNNRTLLLVGDSTMHQSAGTLISMITYGGGKCAPNVVFGRSNDLWKWPKYSNNLYDWVEMIKPEPDLILFSAGAHIHSYTGYIEVWRHLREQVQRIRQLTNATLIWKTQYPGHLNCHEHKEPITHFKLGEPAKDRFQWNLLPLFDQMAIQYSQELDIKILDMSPLYLRPDAHPYGDCLHFCTPGPIDLFSQMLLNMMFTKEL